MANEKKYWQGLAHLNNDPSFVAKQQNEFAEYVPVEEFIGDKAIVENASTNRRDFLKFLGFSAAAATLAACEAPVTKAVPYINRPEEITPGVANWYASTFFDGYDYASVIVKTREGRPIKLEGNNLSKVTMGGTNARVQASILGLYDSNRITTPLMKGVSKTWEEADKAIGAGLQQAKGIAIVSSTIISPSSKQALSEFMGKYPKTRHVQVDAVSYSGMLQANLSTFGKAMIPTYRFDKADVIVSLGCDFLGNWVSPIEHAKQYGISRKVSAEKKEMSKHFQFESMLSMTGANADERYPTKASQLGQVALGLLNAVGGGGSASSVLKKEIDAVAAALKAAKGKALVVAGSNDAAMQVVVNEINKSIGAYGTTIDTNIQDLTHQGDDFAMKKLVDDLNAGTVDTLIFWNTNPVYTAPKALGFVAAMAKASLKVSFATHRDETAMKCDWVCPDHNWLESWNDHNPRTSQYSLQQPTIRPLFKTRQAQESLLAWSGNTTSFRTYIQKYWQNNFLGRQGMYGDFTQFWNHSVQDGVATLVNIPAAPIVVEDHNFALPNDSVPPPAAVIAAPTTEAIPFTGKAISLGEASSQLSAAKGGKFELVIYQKVAMGNGSQANNPWLQEMPDPITKITWDNYVTMHPLDAKDLQLFGMTQEGGKDVMVRFDQMENELDMVEVKANGHSVKLPVWVQPGQVRGTIGIALGYGRNETFGKTSNGVGQNIAPATGMSASGNISYDIFDVAVTKAEGTHLIATTQQHHTMMSRNEDILRETTLTAYQKDERAGNKINDMHTYKGQQHVEQVTLWNDFERPNHSWALAIDLNSCIGCGNCVVSCNVENNVHVVGKDEVRRSREMHWIRIDRYYSSDTVKEEAEEKGELGKMSMYRMMENPAFDNPKVAFQPVMCQHCNHAPCETVCPVLATNHSSEGLNQMTYNRCVGTRYCANNCPYKVRRFNWFNYVEYHRAEGENLNPAADTLGRMVLNPDVTVRARGVMEKCSMCVQRIQGGKLEAKKRGDRPKDGEIQTACSQSCPTNAIMFGDLNDPNSEVSMLEKSGRKFEMLEVVGAKPSVFYLTKVWNREDEKAHI